MPRLRTQSLPMPGRRSTAARVVHHDGRRIPRACWPSTRPDAVAGLGLIASRAAADSETARRGRHDTIEKVRVAGTKALLPGLPEKLVGARAAIEWRPQASLMIERARPDGVMAGLAAMAARPDRTAVFNSFGGPRLVIHGTDRKS